MANPSKQSTDASSHDSGMPQRYRAVQEMVIDYAIGISIVGLNPFQTMLTITLCVAGVLILKMIWDVGRKWRFPRGQNALTIASLLFNLLGAFSMGLMAWLTVTVVGVVFPIINRFAVSAALMTVTWIVGAVTNQFWLNGYLMSDRHAVE